MTSICHWCHESFTPKPKATRNWFCSSSCKYAHYRARNAAELRKYQAEYRKNNAAKVRATKRAWNNRNKDYRRLWYLANSNIVKTTIAIGQRPQMRSRQQAKRIVQNLGWERKCSQCGDMERVHLHHKDGNPLNNDISNLVYLCGNHHAEAHTKH